MKPLLVSLALVGAILAVEPVPNEVNNGVPRHYTDDEIETFAGDLKPPQGATVVDVGQRFSAAMASMNQYETGANSHLGFSIYILEPKAWIGVQKARTIKHFEKFDISKLTENSRDAIFRVFVSPDLPTSALATWAANNAEHVVIRSIDKKLVAQPLSIKESSEAVQNFSERNGATQVWKLRSQWPTWMKSADRPLRASFW